MAVLKCKMCGGDIEPVSGQSYGTCQYCGTQQTLPSAADEQIANLYNRANNFRRLNEFDKAVDAYDKILNLNNKDAEAHWGLVLSKYGIEYVEDEESYERIPTCHRVQTDSILTDADYIAALENADNEHSRSLYEMEARRIAEIQKEILDISNKEKQYDVFICYKEMSESGERTKDSSIAQEVYYELTEEGYKVFFSRITLEDKLGQQYEPYIFAALNSARVMLVIGTKQEYFNAVWVKNEWSRFLKLAKNDSRKLLIPCYRDMDAYDLPEEMSMLQSQDMLKIGFVQDLIRGVKKVIDSGEQTTASTASAATVQSAVPGVESLYRRACLFLEDDEFEQADRYFDRILDIQPEYAKAYIGKLCAEMEVNEESELADLISPFEDDNNYQKALRFADKKYRDILVSYNRTIIDRNEKARRHTIYDEAILKKSEAEQLYGKIIFDSETKAGFPKSSYLLRGKKDFEGIAEMFSEISGFRDADAQRIECEKYAAKCESKVEQAIQREKEKNRKKGKRNIIVAIIVLVVTSAVVIKVVIPSIVYSKAENLLNVGRYEEAAEVFEYLGEYKDAKERTKFTKYLKAESLFNAEKYEEAVQSFAELGDYKDVQERITYIREKQQVEKLAGVSLDSFGGIKWRVLTVKDDKALIITDEIVEVGPYDNQTRGLVTWEECLLRRYLNNGFYNTYFSDAEKELIKETVLTNWDNPSYNTKGGNNTVDKVFALSIYEAKTYFKDDLARSAKRTKKSEESSDKTRTYRYSWWLRSQGLYKRMLGEYVFKAAEVHSDGDISDVGSDYSISNGIRPALWIKLTE